MDTVELKQYSRFIHAQLVRAAASGSKNSTVLSKEYFHRGDREEGKWTLWNSNSTVGLYVRSSAVCKERIENRHCANQRVLSSR